MTTRTKPISDEPLVDVAVIAERLGTPLQTIYDQRKHKRGVGTVPAFKIGGKLKYLWSDVVAWRDQQREQS